MKSLHCFLAHCHPCVGTVQTFAQYDHLKEFSAFLELNVAVAEQNFAVLIECGVTDRSFDLDFSIFDRLCDEGCSQGVYIC